MFSRIKRTPEIYDWDIKQIKMKLSWLEGLMKSAEQESGVSITEFLNKEHSRYKDKLERKKSQYKEIFGKDYEL